jgi:PAS domain S-box-containing protein
VRESSGSHLSELLRDLVDHVPSMLAYWDADQRCRFANAAYRTWFGIAPESLIGAHIRDLLGPLYELNRPFIDAALRGEAQEFEREIPHPAGGLSRHSIAQYIPDVVDGVVRGFFVLVSDVSAFKRAGVALRQAEQRLELTIQEAPIGMALVGTDGRFQRVNRALCEIVGYTSEELTGLTFQAITHPDDLDADLALAAQLERGEIPRYKLAKRYVRKDGTVVDIMLSGAALRGPDGKVVHYIAQIEDITEQRRRECEQRFLARIGPVLASNLDFEETLTRIADLAVEEIADFCIVDCAQEDGEPRRVRVASRDGAKASLCDKLTHVPLDRRRPHLMSRALNTRESWLLQRPSDQTVASLAQGPEHLAMLRALEIESMVAVPLVFKDRLLGAIALVSSRRSRIYDAADVRLAEELASRAALSLENARLYRAARRATQARDDLLGIVVHDLRNPLTNVMLQSMLLQEGGALLDPKCARAAKVIQRSSERMTRLIQDLFDVTRMEAGKLLITPGRVAPEQLLTEAVEAQRALAASRSLELRLDIAPSLPDIWADRDRVNQVIENLLGNAFKFTPAGGAIIVGAVARDADVEISVRDTGPGIPTEHLPHLFDRFWQAGRGDRRGAGLGLPIVKGIVDAHGGGVSVTSKTGEGTVFRFTLRRYIEADTADSETAHTSRRLTT